MVKVWKKIKTAVKEVFNLLTNLLCPVMSAICVIMEVFQLPAGAIQAVKNAEYWCWKVAGTKTNIDDLLEKVDDAVEKTEAGHNQIKND